MKSKSIVQKLKSNMWPMHNARFPRNEEELLTYKIALPARKELISVRRVVPRKSERNGHGFWSVLTNMSTAQVDPCKKDDLKIVAD